MMKNIPFLILLLLLFTPLSADENPALDAIQEFLDFAEYADGTISTEQIRDAGDMNIFFIDARNAGQYAEGHIPGAINIEWREILKRRNEIPADKPVVLYCETGLLSSKAQFMLRLAGYSNIKVLWGGYLVWSSQQSFETANRVKTEN